MARDFSGTNQNINFGSLTPFQNAPVLSISAWVNLDIITADQCVIATFRNGSTGFMLWFDDVGVSANDVWSFLIADSDYLGTVRIEGVGSSATTSLQHIYAEFTANTVGGFRLFINGVEDANSPANSTGGNGGNTGGSGNNVIVGEDSANLRDLNGRISEIGIWTGTHTDAEIVGLSKGLSPLFFPNNLGFYSPLIGRYSPEIDLLGLGSGTVTGATQFVHPRIIYPSFDQIGYVSPAVATSIKDLIQAGLIAFPR